MTTENRAMSRPVDWLVRQHPALAASILAGAMEAVAERLTPTDQNVCRDEWCDGDSREWQGAHVGDLCIGIAEEIKRRCADIVNAQAQGREAYPDAGCSGGAR